MLTVIIPTRGRPQMLGETLQSVAESVPPPAEVVVVDASDDDASRDVVQAAAAAHPGVRWQHLGGTRGACRQRNVGMDAAAGTAFAFLDDDVALDPAALRLAVARLDEPGVVGATGHIVEGSPRRISLKHSPLRRLLPGAGRQGTFTAFGYPNRLWDTDERHDVEMMQGCFMVVRADDARATPFDVRLEAPSGYASLDDEDFALRLSRRGRIVHDPAVVLEHRNTGFSNSDPVAFNRWLVRNRDYTFRKSFERTPRAVAGWWLNMAIYLAHRVLNGDWRGARGLLEGLRDVGRARRGR